jgi:peptidoglycan hydrolase-like protein with peptidoglycan-binding domain
MIKIDMKVKNSYIVEVLNVDGIPMDDYGDKVGISDKSDSATVNKTEQPIDGPIGDISKSAYANVNVPTRDVPKTDNGSLGCAAAVSIIFYRATGYPIIPNKKIELSTGIMWDYLDSASDRFEKITNWGSDYKPGDIIITRRGNKPGHVGVVVEGGKIMSNSSGGFQGDNKGQIELNYTISSWNSVAIRNPNKTAIFRYIGPYRNQWGGEGTVKPNEGPTASTKDSELAYGSEGPEILKMQKALIASGYNLPKYGADGKFFAETRKALKKFQRNKGIAETGRLDAKTQDQLFLKSEDETVQQPVDIIGKKFKIFDNEKRKIVIAKVEKNGTITIKNRIGNKLGSATIIDNKITVEYDGKTMEATEQSKNQVSRSIFRIFNRIKGATIIASSSDLNQTSKSPKPSENITQGDNTVSASDVNNSKPASLNSKSKILFLGDSETSASYSYANSLINDGTVTGKILAQTGASTYVLKQMLRDEFMKGVKYDAVSILAGGNDAWRNDSNAAINNLKSMYQMIKNAGMKVIAISNPTKKFAENPNSPKKKYPSNDEIAKWVEAGGDGLIDSMIPLNSRTRDNLTAFSGDKIHLNSEGHNVVKSLWKESALA